MDFMIRLFLSVSLVATSVRIVNTLRASDTRQGAFRGILSAGERKCVGAALALAVDIDPTHLIHQGIYQIGNNPRIASEQANLLSVIRLNDVAHRLIDVREGGNRDHGPELLLGIQSHARPNGVHDRGET